MARPSRLDNPFVFPSVVRDQLLAKLQQKLIPHHKNEK
jgi:hypothetical protein